MSAVECWECGREWGKDEVVDIPVFSLYTVTWCFKCANKQLKWSDYCIMKESSKKELKEFRKALHNTQRIEAKRMSEIRKGKYFPLKKSLPGRMKRMINGNKRI